MQESTSEIRGASEAVAQVTIVRTHLGAADLDAADTRVSILAAVVPSTAVLGAATLTREPPALPSPGQRLRRPHWTGECSALSV